MPALVKVLVEQFSFRVSFKNATVGDPLVLFKFATGCWGLPGSGALGQTGTGTGTYLRDNMEQCEDRCLLKVDFQVLQVLILA